MASSDSDIGRLAPEELPDAEALVAEAGWNQVLADWRIFLDFGTVYAVRALAHEFAARLGRAAIIVGAEAPTAWLANTQSAQRLFGPPAVPIDMMLDWVADWVARDMPSLGKPTGYGKRDGAF